MTHDEAFEALFTDEYWEAARELAKQVYGGIARHHGNAGVSDPGLLAHLIRTAGERPAYLVHAEPEDKATFKRIYDEVLQEAKRAAESIGACPACGSADLTYSVSPGVAKFKSSVSCEAYGTLLSYG